MPHFIAVIIFIVFMILMFAFAYRYENILQLIISLSIGVICVCAGILSESYLIFFILAGFCFIYAGIVFYDKRPLTKRNHKKNDKENKWKKP